jgi:thiamine kinase-like enzyme
MTDASLAAALTRFSTHIGTEPQLAALAPPILMPMRLAIDAASFSVSAKSGLSLFLKVYSPDMTPFIDVDAAIAAASLAGERGVGPSVRAHDREQGAVLFDLLAPSSWRMAGRNDLRSRDVEAAVIGAKRAWHRAPALAKTRSPFEVIRRYRAMIGDLQAAAPPPLAFHTLAAWTERFEAAIVASGVDLAPIHGDNALSNVMLGEREAVRLVDFDQAVNADPIYDVGALCLEYCSFAHEIEALVELYVGRPDPHVLARAKLYMIVDDFLWGCWALIAQSTSPRSGRIEFYKYAQNCFVRAQFWLASWELDELMRQA